MKNETNKIPNCKFLENKIKNNINLTVEFHVCIIKIYMNCMWGLLKIKLQSGANFLVVSECDKYIN